MFAAETKHMKMHKTHKNVIEITMDLQQVASDGVSHSYYLNSRCPKQGIMDGPLFHHSHKDK
jgi:hypothetical protein